MLVISREINQSIMIGADIELQVLKLRGSSANLHIARRLIGGRLIDELYSGWLAKDQSVDLGESISCAVVDVGSNPTKVRLGIQAPKEISIHRKEVYDAIRRAQQ